jgi:hypothetical protein
VAAPPPRRLIVLLLLGACGGFLAAVLWMDLMFDVQVLRHRTAAEVPEPVLDSIAAYYRRVTTDARPMSHAIAAVMLVGIVALLTQLTTMSRSAAAASAILLGGPILLAAIRIVPNAVRLGGRTDSIAVQSELARAICREHLLCLLAVLAFVALQALTLQ